MNVLVTGGTGFVGSHTVASVLAHGHHARLLVRSPGRVSRALAPLGVSASAVEVVQGDVTDAEAVRAALPGCDAAIHAAGVYSLDARDRAQVARTNVLGTENVLGLASRAGLDPVVHVSSIAAFLDRHGVLSPTTSVGSPKGAYAGSKARADRLARRYQAEGTPVVITYPASVWGPHDPHVGESARLAMNALRGRYRVSLAGGLVMCDVRTAAALHAALLEPGRGPRRFFVPAVPVPFGEFIARLSRLTGRRMKTAALPAGLVLPPFRAWDVLRRRLPVPTPFDFDGAYALSRFTDWSGWDDSATRAEFGLERPDVDALVGETLRWLFDERKIGPEHVGRLAGAAAGAIDPRA